MRLKCRFQNENKEYNVVQGSTLSWEFNETLDGGVINLSQIEKMENIAPFELVYVFESEQKKWNSLILSFSINANGYMCFGSPYFYNIWKKIYSGQQYELIRDNTELIPSSSSDYLAIRIRTHTTHGIRFIKYYFLYDKNEKKFISTTKETSSFLDCEFRYQEPFLEKYLLINAYQETLVNRANVKNRELINPATYSYMITLMSETKGLEGVLCPNLQITQRVNPFTHEFDIEQRNCLEVILNYVDLYSPMIKVVDSKTDHTRKYVKKYTVDTYSWESRQLAKKNCPEMSFANQNLREVIQSISQVLNYFPYVEKNVIKFKDISETTGYFDDSKCNVIQGSQSCDSFQGGTRVSFQNAINNSQVTKHIQNIGFRDKNKAIIVSNENLKIELDYPIFKMSKFEIQYYKNIKVKPQYPIGDISSKTQNTFTIPYLVFTPIKVIIIFDKTSNVITPFMTGNPYLSIYYKGLFSSDFTYELTSSTKSGINSMDIYLKLEIGDQVYFQTKTGYLEGISIEYLNATDKYTILCKQDITQLLQLNSVRSLLSPNYEFFDEKKFMSLRELSEYRYATLGYEIGGTTISGFSETYDKPYSEWWRQNQNQNRTYIENIMDIVDRSYPVGNSSIGKYIIVSNEKDATYNDNVVMPTSDKYKGLFFNIEYYSMNSFDMDFFKEDCDSSFMKRDAQSSSLAIIDNYSNNEQSKVNRYGNKEYIFNGRVTDSNDIQDIGTIYNSDNNGTLEDYAIDENTNKKVYTKSFDVDSDDDRVIIYKKTISINNYFITCSYQGTKHYLLKDYYTTLFGKYRVTSVASYNESVSRNEVINTFIDLDTTKTNDNILPKIENKDVYKYFLYGVVPTNMSEYEALKDDNGIYNFEIYNKMNKSDLAYIYSRFKKGTTNVGVYLLDNIGNFELPYNAVATKQSLVWNIKISDNYSLGNYISNMKTNQGWFSLFFYLGDTTNPTKRTALDLEKSQKNWDEYKGDLQSYYQYTNQYGEKNGIDIFVGKRDLSIYGQQSFNDKYKEINEAIENVTDKGKYQCNDINIPVGEISSSRDLSSSKKQCLSYLLSHGNLITGGKGKVYGAWCNVTFSCYSWKNLVMGLVTVNAIGAVFPYLTTFIAYYNGFEWTEENVWENINNVAISNLTVSEIYSQSICSKPLLTLQEKNSNPLIEYENQDILKDNKECLNYSLQFNYYTTNKDIFIGDYFSKLNGLISSENISIKNENDEIIKVMSSQSLDKSKYDIYFSGNYDDSIKQKQLHITEYLEKKSADLNSLQNYALEIRQLNVLISDILKQQCIENLGQKIIFNNPLILVSQVCFVLKTVNPEFYIIIYGYLQIVAIRCNDKDTNNFTLFYEKPSQMLDFYCQNIRNNSWMSKVGLTTDNYIIDQRPLLNGDKGSINVTGRDYEGEEATSGYNTQFLVGKNIRIGGVNDYSDILIEKDPDNLALTNDWTKWVVPFIHDGFDKYASPDYLSVFDYMSTPYTNFVFISGYYLGSYYYSDYFNNINYINKNFVIFYSQYSKNKYTCNILSSDLEQYTGKVSDIFSVNNEKTISYPYIEILNIISNAKFIGIYYKNYNGNNTNSTLNIWNLVFGININNNIKKGTKIFASFKRNKNDYVYENQANQNIVGKNKKYNSDNYLENNYIYETISDKSVIFEKNISISQLNNNLYAPQIIGYVYYKDDNMANFVLINNNISNINCEFVLDNISLITTDYTDSTTSPYNIIIKGQQSVVVKAYVENVNLISTLTITFSKEGYVSKMLVQKIEE